MGSGEVKKDVDQVLDAIGNWGPWQVRLFFLAGIFLIPGTFLVLVLTFINADQVYWCSPPENMTFDNLTDWFVMSGQLDSLERCHVYDVDYHKVENSNWHKSLETLPTKRPCTSWDYDTSIFETSIMSEWDLVCENSHMRSIGQTLFFAGMLGGVWVAGVLSDNFGRKTLVVPLLFIMSGLGLASAHMPTFASFVVLRSLCAMTFIGILECIFTWLLEICGGKWTTIVGIGVEAFWVSGWLILALLAYIIRDWRTLLTVVSLPGLSGIVLIWMLPESPKWLFSVGRLKEAEVIIREAARQNNKTLPDDWKLIPQTKGVENDESKIEKASILDLVRNRSLLLKSLIIFYNWLVNSFCYYGLALNAHSWGGDVHLSFAINGFLEIPAYGMALIILLKTGRKYTYAISMLSTGIILLGIMALPKDDPDWQWAVVTIATLGKAFVTFSFGTVYLYTAELYPTVLRTTGMGIASFMARFGAMASGWVALLARYDPRAPLITFGLCAFIAGALAFFLPETSQKKLPDTIEESESFKLGLGFDSCRKRQTNI